MKDKFTLFASGAAVLAALAALTLTVCGGPRHIESTSPTEPAVPPPLVQDSGPAYVSIAELPQYDGQPVRVLGLVVADPVVRTSRSGNRYYTFRLADIGGGDHVTVFSFGEPEPFIVAGSRVIVSGTYHAAKRVGRYTFYHQIDAASISQN